MPNARRARTGNLSLRWWGRSRSVDGTCTSCVFRTTRPTRWNMPTADAMDRDLLKAAQSGLRIRDVGLRETRCALAERFEPKYEHPDMDVQLMQRVLRSEVVKLGDGNKGKLELFLVFVELGIRWVRRPPKPRARKRAKKQDDSVSGKAELDVLARIEATFMAEYEMTAPVEQPALDEFAVCNAPFNVWPFWREYVASQANRMNMPKAMMPLQGFRPRKPPVVAQSKPA